MASKIIAFAAIVLAVGCMSTGHWDTLHPQQQDLLNRCWMPMQTNICGSSSESVYIANCRRQAMAQYAEQPTDEARKQWVLGRGCPPPMVRPEAH